MKGKTMKLLLAVFAAMIIQGCNDATAHEDGTVTPPKACNCKTEFTKPIGWLGVQCPEATPASQGGRAINPKGESVLNCRGLLHTCDCADGYKSYEAATPEGATEPAETK